MRAIAEISALKQRLEKNTRKYWFNIKGKHGKAHYQIGHEGFFKTKRKAINSAERLATKFGLELSWKN